MDDFVCQGCGNCCRWPGEVRLESGEADRIAAFLGMTAEEFIDRHTGITRDRRGLTLIEKVDGACEFYVESRGCLIHAVKPRQCATFPQSWSCPGWEEVCAGAIRLKLLKNLRD